MGTELVGGPLDGDRRQTYNAKPGTYIGFPVRTASILAAVVKGEPIGRGYRIAQYLLSRDKAYFVGYN